jgi:hypothetical protein
MVKGYALDGFEMPNLELTGAAQFYRTESKGSEVKRHVRRIASSCAKIQG